MNKLVSGLILLLSTTSLAGGGGGSVVEGIAMVAVENDAPTFHFSVENIAQDMIEVRNIADHFNAATNSDSALLDFGNFAKEVKMLQKMEDGSIRIITVDGSTFLVK